ncbi:hypothetical protein [Acidovorax sp. NCPPB 3576]|uniref:hypothetical protein n=1 Tax=Acidovorax sp. NCPPB 3576 TaxID=2940488 RepID=UPI00234BDD2B|nr:hypothetical protein [Acidovorax sp. NCPPB 3576]WCM86688.1 hypothetical protein M5C98_15010 [Acidovorax sp. NCPPB 3576]
MDATVAAPVRAKKALARRKATPVRVAAPADQTPQSKRLTASEQTVAAAGAGLLGQAAGLIHEEDGDAYASTLLQLGQKVLLQASEGSVALGKPQDVFFFAAGACSGALAIERQTAPGSIHRHELITSAFELLNNTALGYDLHLHPCVEAAAAIEAGARANDPTPKRRRGPSDMDIAKATGSYAAFGRNLPGHVIFDDRAELERFVSTSAAQVACLNVMLQAAVRNEGVATYGSASEFLPDFAEFVSDQAYEHQQAVEALINAGEAE